MNRSKHITRPVDQRIERAWTQPAADYVELTVWLGTGTEDAELDDEDIITDVDSWDIARTQEFDLSVLRELLRNEG